jgi:hypothetical protein
MGVVHDHAAELGALALDLGGQRLVIGVEVLGAPALFEP